IENREDYEKIYLPISEVASDIQLKMNINPGQLYRLLEELSENDIELTLLKNKNAPEDKKIAFFPISDDHLCYYLENFRPKLYYKIRREVQRIFNRRIHQTRTNSVISNLKTPIKEDSETAELWKEFLLRIFNYYPSYEKQLKSKRNRMKIIKALEKYGDLFEKGKKKRREKAKGNKGNKGKKSETNKRKRKKRSKN
ncbi:MAG: hypothetical protein ACOC35_16175, partial [Promethearchaeia archaeon]